MAENGTDYYRINYLTPFTERTLILRPALQKWYLVPTQTS